MNAILDEYLAQKVLLGLENQNPLLGDASRTKSEELNLWVAEITGGCLKTKARTEQDIQRN